MDRDPARPAGDVQHGVQDRPVGDGVGAVLHRLGLAVRRGDAARVEVVPPDDDGGRYGPVCDELVEAEAGPVPLASSEPADARGEALEVDLLPCFGDPTPQTLIIGEQIDNGVVGRRYVRLLARERGPPEGPLALAEERPDVGPNESRIAVCAIEASELRLPAQRVAVVEDLGAPFLEADHRGAVAGHRSARFGDVAALEQRREHLSRVAEDSDGERLSRPFRLFRAFYSLVEVVDAFVEVAVDDAAFYPVGVDLDAEGYSLVHGDGERLGASHAAEAGCEADAAAQGAAEALFCHGGERLVGALEDALGADVDPGPGRHLAVHRETGPLQLPERLPVGPLRDQ